MLDSDGWWTSAVQRLANIGTQLALGGSSFSLDVDAFQQMYAEFFQAQTELAARRDALTAAASGVAAQAVSSKIAGVRRAGLAAQKAVGAETEPSMALGMTDHERALAETLGIMAEAFSRYQRGDRDGAAQLLQAVRA